MRVLVLCTLLLVPMSLSASPDDLVSQPPEIQRSYWLLEAQQPAGLEEARAILERAIAERPADPFLMAEMARYEMKSGWQQPDHMVRAQRWLEKAREVDPERADTYVLLGYVAFHKDRDIKGALAYFDRAERLGTDNAWLHVNRGEVLSRSGRDEAAYASYLKVLDSPKASPKALANAARVLLDIEGGRGWPDVALGERLFLLLIEANPERAPERTAAYIRFLAVTKGDVQRAILLGRKAVREHGQGHSASALAVALLVAAAETDDPVASEAYAAEAKRVRPDLTLPLVQLTSFAPHQLEAIRIALRHGASPDGIPGQPAPISAATLTSDPLLARALLEAGADPNTRDFTGWPVLIQVMAREHFNPKAAVAMVGTLLEFGADPLAVQDGRTVLELVQRRPSGDPIRTMIEAAAKKRQAEAATPSG